MAETKTIKRYRLAKLGDEGRECWVISDGTSREVINDVTKTFAPSYKIDGFWKERPLTVDRHNGVVCWPSAIVADEAPDPGEGYRLLKKQEYDGEEEEVQEGDEFYDETFEMWKPVNDLIATPRKQRQRNHYRRRITPVEAEPEYPKALGPEWRFLDEKEIIGSGDLRSGNGREGFGWLDMPESWIGKPVRYWTSTHSSCFAARRITQPNNDIAKQVEVAKMEFENWPQWKKDIAASLLNPKAEREEAREQPAPPPSQPTDTQFVVDAAVRIFAGLLANPDTSNTLFTVLANRSWKYARELERAQHTSQESTE